MTGLSREAGKILLLRFSSLVVTERVREILTPASFPGCFCNFCISFGQEERQEDEN